jgi:hypothetical protein
MLQSLVDRIRGEVAFVWMTVLVIVNTLQVAAVELPTAVHVVVLIATAVLTAWGIRTNVTPAAKA